MGRLTLTAFDQEWSLGLYVPNANVMYKPIKRRTNHDASRIILLAKIRGVFFPERFSLIIFFDFLLENNYGHSYEF